MNVCRALHAAGHEVIGLDHDYRHLVWVEPYCVEVSANVHPIGFYEPDLVHAQPEEDMRWLAGSSHLTKLMPSLDVVKLCQHKPTASMLWHAAGLRKFPPMQIASSVPDFLDIANCQLGNPFWLRSATGAGAKAATLVENQWTGLHWIKYWASCGENIEWVAEEYLPGRDFCWTGVYRRGVLYASFARERLEWLYPHLAPSGRAGTPTVAVTVHDHQVNTYAKQAVMAVDDEPNGVYGVDMREDRDGIPRPTEINAGRFPTTSPLYSELGPNLVDLYARLGVGEAFEPWGDNIYPAGVTLLRHIDCGHAWRSKPNSAQDDLHPYPSLQLA